MSPGTLRVVLVVGSVLAFGNWPIPSFLLMWGILVWLVPRVYEDRLELLRLQPLARADPQCARAERDSAAVAESRATALEAQLRAAQARGDQLEAALTLSREEITALQRELTAARTASKPSAGSGHPLYQRVGLDQSCPKWVAEAVRREYRKRLHPDGKPAHQKEDAESRFKETEQVFSQIWALRGF